MLRLPLLLLVVACPAFAAAPTCEECTPSDAVDQAVLLIDELRLVAPAEASSDPAFPYLAAIEAAERGAQQEALVRATEAAVRCAESGGGGCGETFALLAALRVATAPDDPVTKAEAAALLSLIDHTRVEREVCVRSSVLRFRLAERVWSAEPAWADACRGAGGNELPYLAARAALSRGEFDDAERRIAGLRMHAPERALRVRYFEAVLHVARGDLVAAEQAFGTLFELGPLASRSEPEDDARALAALQLARLARARGANDEALAYYQRVPSVLRERRAALLEGAVVAAHIGDLGAAKLYLDRLGELEGDEDLDRARVRANLAVIDGDEAAARSTFAALSAKGRRLRASLGADDVVLASLRDDPGLGGLLDPEEAEGLFRLEDELIELRDALSENAAQLAALGARTAQAALDDKFTRADAYLARAERDIGITGEATQRRAAEARVDLELLRERHETTRAASTIRRVAREREIEGELSAQRNSLTTLTKRLAKEVVPLKAVLVARAFRVVEGLEMSEAVGDLELAWRQKREASRELRRLREEYDEGLATLSSDSDIARDDRGQ